MIGQIYHVGLTVSDLDRSVAFYRDVLGLRYQGELLMEGKETEAMFRRENCRARVAYLNGSDRLHMPPVELIQFVEDEIHRTPMDLFTTSISELCFYTEDADGAYQKLVEQGVECFSAPQKFDFRQEALAGVRPSTFGTQMESYWRSCSRWKTDLLFQRGSRDSRGRTWPHLGVHGSLQPLPWKGGGYRPSFAMLKHDRAAPLSPALRESALTILRFINKPPETTRFARRCRRHATWSFANRLQTTPADSFAIAAGGLRAKARLSFKTGVFGAIVPLKAARRALWDKNENSTP